MTKKKNVTTINIIALENNSTINETLAAVKLRGFFIFKYLPVALSYNGANGEWPK